MKVLSLVLVLMAGLTFTALPTSDLNAQTEPVVGTWLNQDKDAHVKIFEKNGKYYGEIVWLKNPLDDSGKARLDVKNDNKELRSRGIMGLQLLVGFVKDGKGYYDDGEIYNPKDGAMYSCYLEMKGNDKLKVRGYKYGMKFLGKTQYWTRVK